MATSITRQTDKRFSNLYIDQEPSGAYVLAHVNGKSTTFFLDNEGKDLSKEIQLNRFLRARVKHFNDHGTMEGY